MSAETPVSILPDFSDFSEAYVSGKTQIVWKQLDLAQHTIESVSRLMKEDHSPFFLLESSELGPAKGRYSIIGMDPDLTWQFDGDSGFIDDEHGNRKTFDKAQCLDVFRDIVHGSTFDMPSHLPDMASGLIGYMAYDMIRLIEPSLGPSKQDTIHIPEGLYMRITSSVVFDLQEKLIYLVKTVRPKPKVSAQEAYDVAKETLVYLKGLVNDSQSVPKKEVNTTSSRELSFQPNMSKETFLKMIETAKDYIVEGDIFQVVPSQRFEADFDQDPFLFYLELKQLNPSPYLFYLQFGDFHLIGSSPEIMVRVKHNRVTIRPLAGTRKRGQTKEEDEQISKELLSDQKEVSEHLMLVDLSRNDVGKVCVPGTVRVIEDMIIEYYSHVMHISSTVEGLLESDYDPIDALFAGLPVGTVSGAPKIRAMQIIDELEPTKRGFYAGCVGYFSANGSMDTCITLRTALVKDDKIYLQAGCGVVSDSDPLSEYQETLNKAEALKRSVENCL